MQRFGVILIAVVLCCSVSFGRAQMPTSAPSSDGGEPAIRAGGIVAFGDSTTAFRPGAIQQVYSVRLQAALKGADCELPVHNAGRGGNTTRDAKARFERDVL
ncbi:MAG: hypothetical protein KDA59_13480, partial [Planctomycetales bacterium]|nr:hypothetical protein [Planctomycetales bacterium]